MKIQLINALLFTCLLSLVLFSCETNDAELDQLDDVTRLEIGLLENVDVRVEESGRLLNEETIDYFLVNFFDIGKQIPAVYYGIFDSIDSTIVLEVPKNKIYRIQVVGLSKGNTFGLFVNNDSLFYKNLHPITNSLQEGDYWADQAVNLTLNDLKYYLSEDSTEVGESKIKASPASVYYGTTDVTTWEASEQSEDLLLYKQGFQISAEVTNIDQREVVVYVDGQVIRLDGSSTQALKEFSFPTNVSFFSSQTNSVEVKIELVENIQDPSSVTEIYNERLTFKRMERKHFKIELSPVTSNAIFPITIVEETFFDGDTVNIAQ